jgi:CBS domain-containing protein
MHVAAVIKRKGSDVVTIASDRTIAEAVNVLAECRIGAILVMDDNDAVGGIISERDRRPPAVAGRRRSHGRQGTHPKRQRE